MAKAKFDIAGKLDLLFRLSRVGNKTFTFLNSSGGAYSLSGLTFQLNVKELSSSATNVFQLLSGSGLTISSNTIAVAVTEVQTALVEKIYYWELYETTAKKTWLCGNAEFISRDPSTETETTSVTVNLIPDAVTITISSGSGASATTLDGLTDVVITSATTGQHLRYNGSEWVNSFAMDGGTI